MAQARAPAPRAWPGGSRSASARCSSSRSPCSRSALGYVSTHTARAVVPADRLGVAHENVTFESTDGLKLEGWYIPSRNGAAIIVTPGRNGPQEQARMLARHGYGVLLFDRRGEGRSEGQPNTFGWGGDRDIKGAIEFLKARGIDRIGGLGLSVGGELMLEAAAETDELDAVVSEGAGARVMGEEIDDPALPGRDRPLAALQQRLQGSRDGGQRQRARRRST